MPEPLQPDARQRAALLLYIMMSGVTDLRQLIARHIAQLHRQCLLWLREQFQHIPAIQPLLWQSAKQAALKLLPVWLARSCGAIFAWLHGCAEVLSIKGSHLPTLVNRKIWQMLAHDGEDKAESETRSDPAQCTIGYDLSALE